MKVKLRLDTLTDVVNFIQKTAGVTEDIKVKDTKGNQVNAKSLIGLVYSLEWNEIWCECEKDIYNLISEFVI